MYLLSSNFTFVVAAVHHFETGPDVFQAGVQLTLDPSSSSSPECWDYSHVPPCLVYGVQGIKCSILGTLGTYYATELCFPDILALY